jgi:hypothetical protein
MAQGQEGADRASLVWQMVTTDEIVIVFFKSDLQEKS